MIATINPVTEVVEARFEAYKPERVEQLLSAAATAQREWARTGLEARLVLLRRVAAELRDQKAGLANLITLEMGKPIVEAEGEVEKCAVTLDFYAENAPRFLADIAVASNASESSVVFDPLGVVLAVMPWNYPLWQFVRFAAPALAAGNGALLKHANNVPQCALALVDVFERAGAPKGLVTTLLIEASAVADLIADPRVAAVTLTGSTAVGKIVAAQAGAAMKKQVLELGGSDPFIVLADADVAEAAKVAVKARFTNAGQSCICAKRFLVDESVADQFVAAMVELTASLKLGNPQLRDTDVGPMARGNLRDELHGQVQRTVAAGAKLLLGGRPIEGAGYFYPPTILDHVTAHMPAATEETFGPVAAIIRVKDADEAVALANATEFGLGASIWSTDLESANQIARRVEAGAVFINGMVASDARLPFGGIKQSGYGRELGEFGIREFTNIKTIWIGPHR